MWPFKYRVWFVRKEENSKIDANALTDSTSILIEENRHEINFWMGIFVAFQGIMASGFAFILTQSLNQFISLLVLIEFIVSVYIIGEIYLLRWAKNILLESYMGIQSKKAGCRLFFTDLSFEDMRNFKKLLKEGKLKEIKKLESV